MVVQHNLQAINANRMLNITTGAQGKSTEKLSSGYRINRAADDAAGLAISEKMRKQIQGLDQASTNAQDGVSAVQTAEGALNEVHSMLQRMNELAIQAANGTNSESDRESIQDEIAQLTAEIDRVSETTKFNETELLHGSHGTKTKVLAGHDAGLVGTFVDSTTTATLIMDLSTGTTVKIAGQTYNILAAQQSTDDVTALQKQVSTIATAGATITLNGTVYSYDATTNAWSAGTGSEYTSAQLSEKIEDGTIVKLNDGNAITARDYEDKNNISADKALKLIQTALVQANNIGVTNDQYSSIGSVTENPANSGTYEFVINKGKATVANVLSFNLHVGADADMTNKIAVEIDGMSAAGLGIKDLNVADDSGIAATYAVDAISDAIATVSAQRASLGAIQNRLEHTISNLDNVVENTTSAESRIRDTDMAEEMVEYSKNNILAQAGQSMLAQANQSTQGVLSLLQG